MIVSGLLNRHVFYKYCKKSHYYAIRHKEPYCIMAVELDNFNQVNEVYGFAAVEKVLKVFSRLANDTLREYDLLACLGAEGFAFFLPNTNLEQANN